MSVADELRRAGRNAAAAWWDALSADAREALLRPLHPRSSRCAAAFRSLPPELRDDVRELYRARGHEVPA